MTATLGSGHLTVAPQGFPANVLDDLHHLDAAGVTPGEAYLAAASNGEALPEQSLQTLKDFAEQSYAAKTALLQRRIASLQAWAERLEEQAAMTEDADKASLQAIAEFGHAALKECRAELERFTAMYAESDDYRWLVSGRC